MQPPSYLQKTIILVMTMVTLVIISLQKALTSPLLSGCSQFKQDLVRDAVIYVLAEFVR